MSHSLKEQFALFSKFGNTQSNGTTITLTQSDKWFKQAKVIDKNVTTTDTGITFNKFKAKALDFDSYMHFIEELARYKNISADDIMEKLAQCGLPGTDGATAAGKADVVSRLTDVAHYTGAHKERFDSSGKGKGIEGREDVKRGDPGYVSGYKGESTYDKEHNK